MGVMVSNLFSAQFDNFDKKIAINGTPKITDDKFGIPERIFSLTLKRFNETSCEKFAKNMFNGNCEIKPKRPWQELKQELESLNLIETEQTICFDKAYISTEDKIVPSQNQLNYWLNKTSTELLRAPHYPFVLFKNWKEIL